jgi:hypothetical protein
MVPADREWVVGVRLAALEPTRFVPVRDAEPLPLRQLVSRQEVRRQRDRLRPFVELRARVEVRRGLVVLLRSLHERPAGDQHEHDARAVLHFDRAILAMYGDLDLRRILTRLDVACGAEVVELPQLRHGIHADRHEAELWLQVDRPRAIERGRDDVVRLCASAARASSHVTRACG